MIHTIQEPEPACPLCSWLCCFTCDFFRIHCYIFGSSPGVMLCVSARIYNTKKQA
ncbi:hypothetical protein K438DRAFT_1829811 [Mycena galopus ATCC 62051]|nr:hypothetical protein K438DRAFT_1829811 [Mycena galopus ATCC 62051]